MENTNTKYLIADVDVGTDDYLALLLFLKAEVRKKVKILAIICSNGNTDVEHSSKNVVRLLETLGRTDIPVYKGASKPLILPQKSINPFHGIDGFGDLDYDHEPNLDIIQNTPGSIALQNIVTTYPNQVSLICLGPLTTIALSIKLYQDFLDNVHSIWLMGGNCKGVGNSTSSAEFNFFTDPEAAQILLENVKNPIYMLPWETCLLAKISWEWRINNLNNQTPEMELLTKVEEKVYDNENWMPCDAFLAAAFINPDEVIIKTSTRHAIVETCSPRTRGLVIIDHLEENKPNVIIIDDINVNKFKEMCLELVQ